MQDMQNPTTKILKIVLSLIFIAALVFAGYYLQQHGFFSFKSKPAETQRGVYIDKNEGFVVHPENSRFSLILQREEAGERAVFTHTSGCRVSYGELDVQTLSVPYTEGGNFDETTKVFWERGDKTIYVDHEPFKLIYLQQRPQVKGEGNIIAAYIEHFPRVDSPKSFLLHAQNETLSPECITDFLTLLKSGIDLGTDAYTITPESTGTVSIEISEDSISMEPNWHMTRAVLAFSNPTIQKRAISFFDLHHLGWVSPMAQLVDTDLYFVTSKGGMSAINLLTKEVSDVALKHVEAVTSPDQPRINDFLIYGRSLFYLTGENCQQYMSPCLLSLYQHSLDSSEDTFLAKDLTAGRILGYDTSLNMLYLEQSWGDAGCYSQTITAYNFNSKTVTTEAAASGCEGEESDALEHQKVKMIKTKIAKQAKRLSSVAIVNGKMSPIQTDFDAYKYESFRYIANQ